MSLSFSKPIFVYALSAVLMAANVSAQEDTDKPSFSVSQSVQMTATVEAVNLETRQVTLKGEDGKSQVITAPEKAQNLDQVQPGDIVVAEFVRKLDVEVFADDGSALGAGSVEAAGRAEKGAQPGAMAVSSEVVTARVAEINLEANTFKLQFPDDSIEEFVIQNPENAKRAAVGDIVVITYTEAIGIAVKKPTGE